MCGAHWQAGADHLPFSYDPLRSTPARVRAQCDVALLTTQQAEPLRTGRYITASFADR